MSNQGDDCYFYFYSTCNKGDSCSFRHCEAALGNETVCKLWQEGRCFRNVCRFRHMEINKKRSEIPCYWEKQPVGCQKYNCAFHHTKGRYIDGLFLPPSKTTLPSPPVSAEDNVKTAQMSLQQHKLSVQSNPSPQLRGVMKVENSENVPSPTHPPVVINAADDDEDDDDLLSEEGDEIKTLFQQPATEARNGLRITATRKSNANTKQDDNLNFKIKTLEEIKLKKLKEKPKKQGEGPSVSLHPLQSRPFPVPEKENVRTLVRTVTLSTKQGEKPVVQLNVSERPGKQKASTAGDSVLPLRRDLAERLGKKVEILENADQAPKREKAAKPTGEIHVKTLEEIRLERANKRRAEPQAKPKTEGRCKTEDPSLGAKPSPAVLIKTFSGALPEKKHKRLEEEKQKPEVFPTETKAKTEPKKQITLAPAVLSKAQPAEPAGTAKPAGEVRVKTLEEIKQEKALRMQQSGKNVPIPPAEAAQTGRKFLWLTRIIAPGREENKIVELSKASPKAVAAPAEPSDQSAANSKVEVKSLEEKMREKQQLKQRQEEKEAAAVPSPAEKPIKDKTPASGTQAKVCRKLSDGKAIAPMMQTRKRKAAESHPSAVAAVKPLKSGGGDMMEHPAKKSAATCVPALGEDSLVPASEREKPQTSPEVHIGSHAEAGSTPLSVEEDDFEKLIWEISGGKLEAEIDLDPGTNEDDLLLELSEMIDS
ncbi:ZC11A protein, partial [Nyctibius bracteatus]|nr:ZC11A protein [Nyctibius bracteatus]